MADGFAFLDKLARVALQLLRELIDAAEEILLDIASQAAPSLPPALYPVL